MTEEEKESIKVLEKYKKECLDEYNVEIEDIESIDEPHAFYLHQQIESIETVLNLIQKQGKQIDFYKKGLERELEDNRKNTCELLKQDLIIREKDKQIDLILDVFFKRFTAQLVLEYGIENKEQLKQKFEQYFKRKAEQD